MIKLRFILALAGCVAALGFLVACDPMAQPPSPTPPVSTIAPSSAATVIPKSTPEPTTTAIPPATSTAIAVTPTTILLPTAEPLPAGWKWYENTTYGPTYFRIAYPGTWTVSVGLRGSNILQRSGIVYQVTFQSPETGSAVVIDIWELSGRREGDLLDWVNSDPARTVFDSVDEPLTYNATVLGRPAIFHYHPARWGTNDFAVTLFVVGEHRYRLHFNSATSPMTGGEPQIYRTMLESFQNIRRAGRASGDSDRLGRRRGAGHRHAADRGGLRRGS
jgi:hypothetical protein